MQLISSIYIALALITFTKLLEAAPYVAIDMKDLYKVRGSREGSVGCQGRPPHVALSRGPVCLGEGMCDRATGAYSRMLRDVRVHPKQSSMCACSRK